MEQNSNTPSLSVPYGFGRCYNTECPLAANCLRRMAALYDANDDPFVNALNPSRFPKEGENCLYFKKAEKVRVAWGVKKLFDKLPYKDAVEIKRLLIGHYGKTKYYRFYREEYYLDQKEQNYILRVFRNKGMVDTPSFTRYTEEYIW